MQVAFNTLPALSLNQDIKKKLVDESQKANHILQIWKII